MTYAESHWFSLLADAVANHPKGKQGVADKLGVSRPMISLVMAGRYANTKSIEKKVLEVFDRVRCPYLGSDIPPVQCAEVNSGPVPTWDPAALDQRRCCQTCPNKPVGDKK